MSDVDVVVADRHPPVGGALSRGGSVVDLIQRGAASVDPDGSLLWASPAVGVADERWLGGPRLVVELADVSPEDHASYYFEVGAGRIWPVLHDLAVHLPDDAVADGAWEAYVRVNDALARAVADAAPPDARVTVHDYSVLLSVRTIRALRPDLRLGYVHHTPWPHRNAVADEGRRDLLRNLFHAAASADVVFVSAQRWGVNLESWGPLPQVRVVHPGVDAEALHLRTATPGCGWWTTLLDEEHLERPIVATVGRADPSKNVDTLVRAWTELVSRGRRGTLCVHQVPTSRKSVDIYRRYAAAVDHAVAGANRVRAGSVVVSEDEDQDDALRLLGEADVVAVCSRADGWNLVAAEAAAIGPPGQRLVLSSRLGSAELLAPVARVVADPESPAEVAEVLEEALDEPVRQDDPHVRVAQPTPGDWWSGIVSGLDEAIGTYEGSRGDPHRAR